MKSKHLAALVFLCIATIFLSCKKNIDTAPVIPTNPGFDIPAVSPVSGRISGVVVDENNTPVQGADVVFSGSTYQTDANGLFNINNATLDKYVTTVTVNKAGYFKALRSFSATASRNYLSIKLIPKTLAGTISATAGGSINLANGTGITFQSNTIVIKSTGAAYSGAVNVYASYIDPTSSDFATRVPGSMMGQDAEHMFVLQSTGMIAVDLESSGGQALQLANGSTAAIKMPVPSSLLSKAPATIDTWSLDDRGVWIKEGTATKNGNYYDMEVTHFSFWNCDVPANAVYLTINLHDQNGNPLSNTFVELTIPNSTSWWASTYGFTDSSGTVSGLVPANLGLVMDVMANNYNCATTVYTQNVGPFSSDTTLNITVTLNNSQYVTITGTLNDCNGQPVANGTASLLAGNYGYYYAPVVNGSYSFTVLACSAVTTGTIWLADGATGAAASPVNISISGNTVTVPAQTACGQPQAATFDFNGCGAIGNYYVDTALNANNYIYSVVNVLVPGNYTITSTTTNGMTFSGSGTLTHTGLDTVYLQGSGTPLTSGAFTFAISGGGQTCAAVIFVEAYNPPAVFNSGAQGSSCAGAVLNGNYVVNFPLNQTNSVIITVNVISPGYYYINTGTVNGMYFQDSGVFNSPGVQAITLYGYGTPTAANTSTFTTQANGVVGCSFDVISTVTGSAIYTFEGAPGTCSNVAVSGTYQAGVALTFNNFINIQLNVTSVGAWSVMTNPVNGMSFSGSGVFTAPGIYTVALIGSGTPVNSGTYTFLPNGGSSQGCIFIVPVN